MPVITITRGTLAGALQLAESVAEELQIPCVSREVIVEAARAAGAAEDTLLEHLDRAPSFVNRHAQEREVYLWHVRAALCQRALAGSFVYHGHGGNLLLSDILNLIRVHVVAPLDFRVKSLMESQGMEAAEAAKHIQQMDRRREKWVRYLYEVDWRDPSLYDLIVNVEKLSVAEARRLLVDFARQPRFAWTEASRQNVADVALATRVTAALAEGGELYLGAVELRAEAGVLTVRGAVRSNRARKEVQTAVERVIGQAEVRFDLRTSAEGVHFGFESL